MKCLMPELGVMLTLWADQGRDGASQTSCRVRWGVLEPLSLEGRDPNSELRFGKVAALDRLEELSLEIGDQGSGGGWCTGERRWPCCLR